MTLANRHTILSAIDWDYDEFHVPNWGIVRIRALSAAERLELVREYGEGQLTNERAFAFFAHLAAMSLVDEDGNQLFDQHDEADVKSLLGRNWSRLQMVADRVLAFNGMTKGEAEALEKN